MADSTAPAQIDYTARDFTGYRDAMFQYASRVFPEWTSRSPSDFGVVMVELFAYLGDINSFYQDRVADEAYLSTATQRSSVLAIAATLGYTPYTAMPAIGTVTFQTLDSQATDVTVPAGTQVITAFDYDLDRPVTFETDTAVTVPALAGTAAVTVTEGATQGSRSLTVVETSGASDSVTVEDLGTSSGSAEQTYTLAAAPVLSSTLRVFVEAADGGVSEWQYVTSLADAAAADQSYTTAADDAGVVTVAFGDGVHGAIPATGLAISAAYRVGGGAYGNLPANSIVDLASSVTGVSVAASSAMTGGADAEPLDLIRTNAPRVYRARDRAVARRDYADLALAVPGIAKASAVSQSATSVALYVMGPANLTPTQAQRDQVTAYVVDRAVAGTQVLVFNGSLVPVNFGTATAPVVIGVNPAYRRTETQLACTQALQSLLDPAVTDFGQRIPLSAAYQALTGIAGVDYAQIPMMARADLAQTGTADIVCRSWEIPVIGTLYVNAVGGI